MEDINFLSAAFLAVKLRSSQALREACTRFLEVSGDVEHVQTVFREVLPLQLDPEGLVWLLREISGPAFEEKRDLMIDALVHDLTRNGYQPGIDFSIVPDDITGRAIVMSQEIWGVLASHIEPQPLAHHRCFTRVSDDHQTLLFPCDPK